MLGDTARNVYAMKQFPPHWHSVARPARSVYAFNSRRNRIGIGFDSARGHMYKGSGTLSRLFRFPCVFYFGYGLKKEKKKETLLDPF